MKVLSSRAHGVLDYLVGIFVMMSPWFLHFAQHGAETWVPVTLGALAIVYSLFTRYELSMVKLIPFRTHLAIDVVSGLLLAVSPWVFGFESYVYIPHLLMGILEMAVVMITYVKPT